MPWRLCAVTKPCEVSHRASERVSLARGLRLCTTLPSIFCFGQKKHRDAGQKMLQGWLRTAQQGLPRHLRSLITWIAARLSTRLAGLLRGVLRAFPVKASARFCCCQLPSRDSRRLQIFEREAAAVSAFPESSKAGGKVFPGFPRRSHAKLQRLIHAYVLLTAATGAACNRLADCG